MNPDNIYGGFPLGGGPLKSILETKSLTLLCCAFPTRQPEGTRKNEPLSAEQ